jgi:hypothetical protein
MESLTTSGGGLDSLLNTIADFLSSAIDRTDESAARERVQVIKRDNPAAHRSELAQTLIQRKCLMTGGLGLVTPAFALIGLPINVGLVFKWQAELLLEMAALYDREMDDLEKRNAVLIVTGLSIGSTQVARLFAGTLEQAIQRFSPAEETTRVTTPAIQSVISGTSNVVFTYIVGKQAQAYFENRR